MAEHFPRLFSPMKIGPVTIKNRIMSTAHQTTHVEDHVPTPSFLAYHHERAKGGVGLIVLEAHTVVEGMWLSSHTLSMANEAMVPIYQRLAEMVKPYGTKVFVQIGHTGTERYDNEYMPPADAPSDVASERFHVSPAAMTPERIQKVIADFGSAADRVRRTGLNGVELLGSHGYLISQFWSPETNLRTDEYGGRFENRMRFAREVISTVRKAISPEMALGIRLSLDEKDGLGVDEMIPVVQYLESLGMLDYINVVLGTSRTYYGCNYIVPPHAVSLDEVHTAWKALRESVKLPILGASRHTRPAEAEDALAEGLVDVVGMTRALISDPYLPNKAREGRLDEILYCIGCNQSCIGRYQKGLSLQCLQNPATGREEEYAEIPPAAIPKRVLVIGGGPAGLQAAATAARRGHKVTLVERSGAVGGAARPTEGLPGRSFALLGANLYRQAVQYGAEVRLNIEGTPELVAQLKPEVVIVAVGADALRPNLPGLNQPNVVTATEVLEGKKPAGRRVLMADWGRDWGALDATLKLAEQGYQVELVTAAYYAGEHMQQYVRNKFFEAFYRLGVKLTPHYRLKGIEGKTVKLQNLFSLEMEERRDVDTLVLAQGGAPRTSLWQALQGCGAEVHQIGDCVAARGAEEAIWEGFQAALAI